MTKTVIKLGDLVRDSVSELEGVAVTKLEYLNGCVQFGVQAKANKGSLPRVEYIDKSQLVVMLAKLKPKKKVSSRPPGGSSRQAPEDSAGRM